MPLPILVAVVGGGIVLVVLVVHLTGGSQLADIADAGVAQDRFAIDYPEAAVLRCILSEDRRDAVLELADGHVGLVHAIGSKFLTRFVSRGEMTALANARETGAVDLNTGDITWPRARLHFADDETAKKAASLFAANPDPKTRQRAA